MKQTAMDAVLVELALAYYREPLRYPRLTDPRHPLPAGFGSLVPAFGGALAPRHIAATAAALAVSPEEILEAARFLVRQVLLAPGASPLRMLGFEAEATPVRIRQHYQLLIRLFHPDRQVRQSDLDTEYAARLNSAYQGLRGDATAVEGEEGADGEDEESQAAAVASDELRRFFHPQQPITPRRVSRSNCGNWLRMTRRTLLAAALLLIVGVAGFILVSLMWPTTVHLQMSANPPAKVTLAERQPSYIKSTATTPPEVKPLLAKVPESKVASLPASPASPLAPPEHQSSSLDVVESERDHLTALEQRQHEIAEEMARIEKDREDLARQQDKQAQLRQAETQRLEVLRQETLAEAERQQRQVAEAEARLQVERKALEQQRGDLSRQEHTGTNAAKAEQQAALLEAERKLLQAAEAEVRLKAEREVLERQKAEQARREQDAAKGREAERQAALAVAKRQQQAAAEAEALKVERLSLERQQAEEQARREVVKTRRHEAESKAPIPAADPNNVVARLTQVYGSGDLEGLVNLFTTDAQVSGGRGQAFIRGDYRDFFAQSPYRQLRIYGMKWRAGQDGRLICTGSLALKTRQSAMEDWQSASGSIRFELVPAEGGYKISGMEHMMR
ncbi:MAG: hypothetical protein KAX46_07830 [Chromatiaceae bacterium]|nr:hypothetical protein [Chromatiaceae bacterium]